MYSSLLDSYIILAILATMLLFFIYNKWEVHIVALGGLLTATALQIVPLKDVYSGINNPAVITVACIMMISYAITGSGILNLLMQKINALTRNATLHILSFSLLSAFLSTFMNNVGALGIMLPAAIHSSWKQNRSPSLLLMPIAMASGLGGMVTLIGTPTNLILSTFREQAIGKPYSLFDFAYVGGITTVIGTCFIGLLGWRLLQRVKSRKINRALLYTTEIEIHETSNLIDEPVSTLKKSLKKTGTIVGLFRNNRRCELKNAGRIKTGDIFIIESGIHDLQVIAGLSHSTLIGQAKSNESGEHYKLVEALIPVNSKLLRKKIDSTPLAKNKLFAVIAISRLTGLPLERIHKQQIQLGDMLLLQCEDAADESKLKSAGLLPMTEHNLQFGNMTSLLAPILIFSLSILTILLNILPAEIAFAAAAFFIYLQKPTILHNLAQAVNWQVIVLIASMIPLGDALIHTGAAQMLANGLLILTALLPPMGSIALVMCTTILLSSFINNAATAILVAPIAISIANNTGIPVDAVLMATAIGASAAFLTPIAHQNNLLVMEPGNYRFIDFLILGAPLELIIIVISCPLISYFWA